MLPRAKISLQVPYRNDPDRIFTFRLKPKLNTEVAEYPAVKHLFIVSDIEGNFRAFTRLLFQGGVIDQKLQWTFDQGHLVILGDCFDRGSEVVECLWLIYSLEERARRAGGYVHFILGNHELMNLNGDWRYVHPKYAERTFSIKSPPAALYGGNIELWKWLCTKNIIEKIGPLLFVHGGISEEFLQLKLSVNEINELARPYYSNADSFFNNPLMDLLFNGDASPLWFRGYYDHSVNEELINKTLQHFGVNAIITGHTMLEQVTSFYDGKVFNVDTDHANERSEALIIRNYRFYRLTTEGKKEKLK